MFDYLKEELDNKDKELFLVVTTEVENNQDWLNNHSTLERNNLFERDAEVVQLKDIVRDNATLRIGSLPSSKEDGYY